MQIIQNKSIAPNIRLYRQHKIFIETVTPNRIGRVFAEDRGAGRVFYLIQDTRGHPISSLGLPEFGNYEDSARIKTFNRYLQAGKLRWQE